ncbi:ATP-binding protein, partial [bacterium]|nr:ATP-binding protein [bacterium]
ARDLNRNFGTLDQPEPRTEHCRAVWEFIESERPEWIFDLHEGFDFHHVNPKSVGSSVIAFPDQTKFATKLQKAVNESVPEGLQFDLLDRSGPVVGSLARAGREKLGANSFILETTFKDQPVSKRARQHRIMVSTAFLELGMLQDIQVDCLMPRLGSGRLRVGVFDDAGASESKVMRVLDPADNLVATVFGPEDVKAEVLSQFDVLIFPGGSGSAQGKAIGAKGREVIRDYVQSGGGVIGICAGAYLCSSHYQWSLNLMNAKVFNVMVDVPELGPKSMCDRLRQQQQTIEKETHQRIDAIEQLRHADRLKTVGQLAAGFAHEVGTPLNVISGRAEMILSDPNRSPEQIAKHATAVKTESERISKIIQKLLHFSRRSPSQKFKNDLREVIHHSVELIQPLADKQQVNLTANLPAAPAEASFDFNQLQQVIMNLIDNAVDASPANQTVGIYLHPQPINDQWKIEIADHGSGIEKNQLDVIFEPFFTTKEVGSGTGLGLSIVHGIIEEHGGSIDCQSDLGVGTTMTIRIPIQQNPERDLETNDPPNDQAD